MVKQAGILPYRRHAGRLEVLLVTSTTRGRWIIPKGNVEPHLSVQASAAKEAYEEAGVRGRVHSVPFGSYLHDTPAGRRPVDVYLMEVERQLDRWPEAERRERRWMSLTEAKRAVLEDGLRQLLEEADEMLH